MYEFWRTDIFFLAFSEKIRSNLSQASSTVVPLVVICLAKEAF